MVVNRPVVTLLPPQSPLVWLVLLLCPGLVLADECETELGAACANDAKCVASQTSYVSAFCQCQGSFHGLTCEKPGQLDRVVPQTEPIFYEAEQPAKIGRKAFVGVFVKHLGESFAGKLTLPETVLSFGADAFVDDTFPTYIRDPGRKAAFAFIDSTWMLREAKKRRGKELFFLYPLSTQKVVQGFDCQLELGNLVDQQLEVQYQVKFKMSIAANPTACVPEVTIEDCGQKAEQPTNWNRGSDNVARATVATGCRGQKTTFERSWSVLSLCQMIDGDPLSQPYPIEVALADYYFGKCVKPVHTAADSKELKVAEFTLGYGPASVALRVQERPEGSGGKRIGTNSAVCWINVVPMPLNAVIDGDDFKTVSVEAKIVLDGSPSNDPNEPADKQSIRYAWSCSVPTDTSDVHCQKDVVVGRGVKYEPNFKLELNIPYSFQLKVESGLSGVIVPESAVIIQQIVVIEGSPPELNIECVLNCEAVSRASHTEVVFLRVVCIDFCTGDLSPDKYEWSSEGGEQFDWTADTYFGKNSDKLAIREGVLMEGVSYTFSVTLNAAVGKIMDKYVIDVNKRPILTTSPPCTWSPASGTVETDFQVVCHGFGDEETNWPLRFYIYQADELDHGGEENFGIVMTYLLVPYPWKFENKMLRLMEGDASKDFKSEITVKVKDHYGMDAVFSFELQITELEEWTMDKVLAMYEGLDPTPSVAAMLEGGDSSRAVRLIVTLSKGISRIKPGDNAEALDQFGIDMKEKFVRDLGKVPVKTASALDQVSSALQQVLQADKQPIHHGSARKGSNILLHLSKYLLTRAYRDVLPGHLPTKGVKQIAQTIISCVSSILPGISEVPKPVTPPPTSLQDIEYPFYEDYQLDAVKSVVDYNEAATHLMDSIHLIGKAVAYRLAESLGKVVITSENISLLVVVDRPTVLSENFMGASGAGIKISRELGKEIEEAAPVINLQLATTTKNPLWFKKHIKQMNSDYLFLSLYDRFSENEMILRNWQASQMMFKFQPTKPLDIFLPLRVPIDSNYTEDVAIIKLPKDYIDLEYEIIVFKVVVEDGSLLQIDFKDDKSYPRLSVVIRKNERPGIDDFDRAHSIPSATGDHKYTVQHPEKVGDNQTEWFYLGILPYLEDVKKNIAQRKTYMKFKYSFTISTLKCSYWNLRTGKWTSDDCKMMPDTNKSLLHCHCTHLSLFSGAFASKPSKIDPFHAIDLFLALMYDNQLIIGLIGVILTLLVLLFIWAWCKKRKDSGKKCITILADNRYCDRYGYVVVLYTGKQRHAATSANIGMQLIGSRSNSNSHVLKDPSQPRLERNSEAWFLMFTREDLGEIKTVRIWSDCSGHYPAWFCDKVMVICLETKCTQVFLVSNWLSATLGDGSVYRLIESAKSTEIFASKHLFKEHLRLGLHENHLWAGIWFVHPRSKFSRMERILVLACFIMLLMLFSLVLYEIPNRANLASQIDYFYYEITIREILIAVTSVLVTTTATAIIKLIFIKTKPSHASASGKSNVTLESQEDSPRRETSAKVQESNCLFTDDEFDVVGGSCLSRIFFALLLVELLAPAATCKQEAEATPGATGSRSPLCICRGKCVCPPRQGNVPTGGCFYRHRVNQHRRWPEGSGYYWFPRCFVFFAWLLCIFIIVISAALIIYYGMLFGAVKTLLWLTSVIFATVFSILIVEPLKAVLVAYFLGIYFRKCPKTLRPDCDIDVKYSSKKERDFKLGKYEDRVKHRTLRKMYRPLPLSERDKIKTRIELQNQLADVLIDLVLFVVFIFCLYVVVWFSRDTLAFESTKNIHNMVVAGSYGGKSQFEEVHSMKEYQDFLKETVIHGLQAMDNYNDQPTNDIGVTSDFTTHLLGIPRLRQLRVQDNSCPVHELFNGTITECRPDYSWNSAEVVNYTVGWTHKKRAYEDLGVKLKDPWLFRSNAESTSLPIRGKFTTYPGSGYIANLGRTRRNSLVIIEFLIDYDWFDPNTRVIFVEFTTYSSSRNLFNVVALVAERGATGGWETTENIKTVKLLVTTSEATVGGKIAFLACAIVLCLHLARSVLKFFRVGWRQFYAHLWNVVDFLIVCLCVACISLYLQRSAYVSALLKQLESTQHNEYVSFQAAAFWDIVLCYVLAILVCITTLRIWKLLRFGEMFRMLELTLYSAIGALAALLLTLCISLVMFVLFSYLLMGNNVEHFRDPYRALTTLLASTIGFHDLDMDELWAAHPLLGPLFFLCFLITSTIFLVNMFITVVISYYETAQVNVIDKKTDYGPIDYLRDEMRFHFGFGKEHAERLRGGADTSSYPIAIPKPAQIREENAEKLPRNRLEAMRLLTVDALKSQTTVGDAEGGDSHTVSDERLEAMLLIALEEIGKDSDDEEKEGEVFYKGRVDDETAFVPESRVLDAETVVNKLGKTRKVVNQETLETEAGGEMCEEFEMLNNNLDYLSHLLDQFHYESEAVGAEEAIGIDIPMKLAVRASKSEPLISSDARRDFVRIQRPAGCRHKEAQNVSPLASFSPNIAPPRDAPRGVSQLETRLRNKRPLGCRHKEDQNKNPRMRFSPDISPPIDFPREVYPTKSSPIRGQRPQGCRRKEEQKKCFTESFPAYTSSDDVKKKMKPHKRHHHCHCRKMSKESRHSQATTSEEPKESPGEPQFRFKRTPYDDAPENSPQSETPSIKKRHKKCTHYKDEKKNPQESRFSLTRSPTVDALPTASQIETSPSRSNKPVGYTRKEREEESPRDIQIYFKKSSSEDVANAAPPLEALTRQDVLHPGCRRRDEIRSCLYESPFPNSTSDDSLHETKHKKRHHRAGCRKLCREKLPAPQQEFPLHRKIPASVQENLHKHRKRHHRAHCDRRNSPEIPQCRRWERNQQAPLPERESHHKKIHEHSQKCSRRPHENAAPELQPARRDDCKRWETNACFGPMVYRGRNIEGSPGSSSPVEEELENQINSIEGFTLILNLSGAKVMFRGSRSNMANLDVEMSPSVTASRPSVKKRRRDSSSSSGGPRMNDDRRAEREVVRRVSRNEPSDLERASAEVSTGRGKRQRQTISSVEARSTDCGGKCRGCVRGGLQETSSRRRDATECRRPSSKTTSDGRSSSENQQ